MFIIIIITYYIFIIIIIIITYVQLMLENRYRNQIYLTRAEVKNFKYLLLNENISPENMGMDIMVLKV